MLRCDASRIHLTPTDLHGLDERIALRRRSSLNRGTARLSLGPRLQTSFSVIEPNAIVHKHQPASNTSQASLCAAEDTENDIRVKLRGSQGQTSVEQEAIHDEQSPTKAKTHTTRSHAAEALEAILHKVSPPRLTFHHRPDSTSAARMPGLGHRRRKTTPPEHTAQHLHPNSGLDGAVDQELPPFSTQPRALGPDRTDNTLRSDADRPASTQAARRDANTHGRRGRTRSHDGTIHDTASRSHLPGPGRLLRSAQPTDSPQSVFEVRRAQVPPVTALDPGAPVFTPRVRFGTIVTIDDNDDVDTASRATATHTSLHPARGLSDLRLRSPSEQNVDPAARSRSRNSPLPAESTATAPERTAISAVASRQRISIDQPRRSSGNSALPRPSPNLERYPLLLPTPNAGRDRSDSGRSEPPHADQATVRLAVTPETVEPRSTPQSSIRLVVDESDRLDARSAGASPCGHYPSSLPKHSRHAIPMSSHSRDSSVAASRPTSSQSQRLPSMCSAASGISSIEDSAQRVFSRHPSRETLDAAAEFLRFRSSPLDDLTAELSRLSTALSAQRPTTSLSGRESRSGRGIRLLNGDPFRQSTSLISDLKTVATRSEPTKSFQAASVGSEEQNAELPTSAEQHAGGPEATHMPHAFNDTSASSNKSPSHTVTTPHHRTMMNNSIATPHHPHTTATPKLPIYNDATPAHLQPQTPADIATQSGRCRRDPALPQPPADHSVFVGRVAIASPPIIPERRFFRNTYPTAVAGHNSAQRPGPERNRSSLRRHQRSVSAEEAENDIEGQLVGLEADRRVWLGRRGEVEAEGSPAPVGGLETTPPGEGRFERFLS